VVSHENAAGRPLADANWLEAHHLAKLPERTAFATRLAALRPRRIVDLGCATGLWLELLNEVLPANCELIGIDSDEQSLNLASQRAEPWQRQVSFLKLDLEADAADIPAADLTLAFNIFSYIEDLNSFLTFLSRRSPRGSLVIRQYDGASIRFGPMPTTDRQQVESTLRVATNRSERFRHYDLDRAFEFMRQSSYEHGTYEFELFARTSFPVEFLDYYRGTLRWTRDLLSPTAASLLDTWLSASEENSGRYFFEVDLVAILS